MPSMPDPAWLLEQMKSAYAACTSYRDRGHVTTKIITERLPARTQSKPFITHFVRPDRFRFEFRSRIGPEDGFGSRYVIWQANGQCDSYWNIGDSLAHASLGDALVAAQGVSGRASQTVPDLLMPGVAFPGPIRSLASATITRTTLLGVPCFAIQGTTSAGEWVVYLDEVTFLIRGIGENKDFTEDLLAELDRKSDEAARAHPELFPNYDAMRSARRPTRNTFKTETLTTYTPEINVEVDRATFESPLEERWFPDLA